MIKNKYGETIAPVEFQIKIDPTDPESGTYGVTALFKAVRDDGDSYFPSVSTVSWTEKVSSEAVPVMDYFVGAFERACVKAGIGEKQ